MTLIQTPPQNSSSFLSKVTAFLLLLIKSSSKAQFKTLINLKGPNQAVDEHRQGLVPMFLHKRNACLDFESRKNLLKKRYYQILQEQDSKKIGKQKQFCKKVAKKPQSPKIKDLQDQIRTVNTLMISTKRSKIFQHDFFEHSPKLDASSNEQKVLTEQEKGKNFKVKKQEDQKRSQEIEIKQEIQRQKQEDKKILRIQSPVKANENMGNNPFLVSTTKKLSFCDLISGVATKKKQYLQNLQPQQSKGQTIQINREVKQQNLFTAQKSFPDDQTSKQPQICPHKPSISTQNFNIFSKTQNQPNFAQNSAPISHSFMSGSYQDSASLFMAPHQEYRNALFIDPPANQSKGGKQRGRKKKGAARVYQN